MKKSFKIMFVIIMFVILLRCFHGFAYADSVVDDPIFNTDGFIFWDWTAMMVSMIVLATSAILFFNLQSKEKTKNEKENNSDKNETDDNINKRIANLKKVMCICGIIIGICVFACIIYPVISTGR